MPAPEMRDGDQMECRSCGREERASEGYPCATCGTFICIACEFRGVFQCRSCTAKSTAVPTPPLPPRPVASRAPAA